MESDVAGVARPAQGKSDGADRLTKSADTYGEDHRFSSHQGGRHRTSKQNHTRETRTGKSAADESQGKGSEASAA